MPSAVKPMVVTPVHSTMSCTLLFTTLACKQMVAKASVPRVCTIASTLLFKRTYYSGSGGSDATWSSFFLEVVFGKACTHAHILKPKLFKIQYLPYYCKLDM